jgi:hypothetical protein
VYLDDMMVIGLSFQEHVLNMWKVFLRFQEAILNLNQEKCHLFQKGPQYLGHSVSPKGITTESEKLQTIQEWPTSNNNHKIRSFLGL